MALLLPHAVFRAVTDIDPSWLLKKGVAAVAVDADSTLTPHGGLEATPEVVGWLTRMQAAGLQLMIVSNNKELRVSGLAQRLGLPYVSFSLKPYWKGFRAVCKAFRIYPHQLAVVGDQIFTDVLGGNLFGAKVILVDPIPEGDRVRFRVKRFLEGPFRRRAWRVKGAGSGEQ